MDNVITASKLGAVQTSSFGIQKMVFRLALLLIVASTAVVRSQEVHEARIAADIRLYTKLAIVSDDESMKDNVSAWEKLLGEQTWFDKSGQHSLRAIYKLDQVGRVTLVTEKGEHKSVELASLGNQENARVASIERLRQTLDQQAHEIMMKNGEIYWKLLTEEVIETVLETQHMGIELLPMLAIVSEDPSMKESVSAWEKLIDMQTWFDKSGQYSLSARYRSDQDGKVTLVTETGERKSVELTSLGIDENARVESIKRLQAKIGKQATVVMIKYAGDSTKIFLDGCKKEPLEMQKLLSMYSQTIQQYRRANAND